MRINIELPEGFTPAYNKIYLDSVIIAHKSGYDLFNTNEKFKEFSTASLVDAYMRTSKARSGMDNGGRAWFRAPGGDTIIFTTDTSECEKNGEKMDDDTLMWIAEAYTVFQWMYRLKSKEISEVIPAKRMEELYEELKNSSMNEACDKLLEIFNSAR